MQVDLSILKQTIQYIKQTTILFLIIGNTLTAQNLIPNGDFELYYSLPNDYGQCNLAIHWNNVNGHYSSDPRSPYASPDYYHERGTVKSGYFGKIPPYSGLGQIGLVTFLNDDNRTNFREYLSIPLSTQLKAGEQYILSFALSNGNGLNNPSNHFGIHFSEAPLNQTTHEPIPATPQLEISGMAYHYNYWKRHTLLFTPTNNFTHITIGNFYDDDSTEMGNEGSIYRSAYYFIDDIKLFPIDTGSLVTGDTLICKGDTANIFALDKGFIGWAEQNTPAHIFSSDSSILVSPKYTTTYLFIEGNDTFKHTVHVRKKTELNLGGDRSLCNKDEIVLSAFIPNAGYLWQNGTTSEEFLVNKAGVYWVTVSVNGCTIYDTVIVSNNDCSIAQYIPNIFTPNGDGINDMFSPIKLLDISAMNTYIYNRWGRLVFETDNTSINWTGDNCADGIYFWVIQYQSESGIIREEHGEVTLIRGEKY